MIEIFTYIILIIIINFIFKKKLLLNYTGQLHQTYNNNHQVPLTGGIFILIFFYYSIQYFEYDFIICLSFFLIRPSY